MKCTVTVKEVPQSNPNEIIDMLARAIVAKLVDEQKNNAEKLETNTTT